MRREHSREAASGFVEAELGAPRKRLDALRGTDERRHHEDADRKQHGLQDVRAGVVETEQDRERPAAGERRAEHFGADQDRRADDGDDGRPDDLAAPGRRGLRTHGATSSLGRNLPEKCSAIKRKRPKKAPSRDITSSIYSGRKQELLMSETLETAVTPQVPENPLLKAWQTPFETPPFAEISPEHFLPAFEQAFADHAAEVAAITHDPSAPDFANTITALERSGKLLSKVSAVFYDLVSADSNPALLEIDKEVSLRMARHWNPIMMNAVLFGRIAMLHENRASLPLTAEQKRLLERTYTRFRRAGAGLDDAAKARMAEINERLAHLGTAFSHHLLGDEQDWFLELGEADRDGLPDSFIAAAKAAAGERGMEGKAIVTLSRSSVEPFLKSSTRRDLREKVYKAFIARGDNDNANDNTAVIVEILKLREESAGLLGFPTFAAYRLEDSMAKTPEAVRGLLERVWKPARARALRDRDDLQALVAEEGGNFALAPWDWRYYAEKLRQVRANFDDAAIKPYLVLDHIIEAAFDTANRLFGVSFSERKDIPVWHPDVRIWEVKDAAGQHKALFYGDYFARPSKRSGAWMTSLRDQQKLDGDIYPLIVNVCNFSKGADGQPSLLSPDDARTLFHEFGHGLHGMLSEVTYPSLSGTSVFTDFVELPSQLYEHWQHRPQQFGHIFSGDHYASGYYSYMWSEVMDADAFGASEEAGNIFDTAVAKRLHDDIYSSGGSRDPEQAYVAFRGREPEPDALLRRRGLLETSEAA